MDLSDEALLADLEEYGADARESLAIEDRD
jgi:hypothetical protein